MSHLHLPDGVLPPWLWIGGYLLTAILMVLFWRGVHKEQGVDTQRFALLGIFAALMILAMSIEIPPYHANLSVVTAIILGPSLAIVAGFIVNLFLALVGHGGITVVGLNTLIIAVEMLVGQGVFRLFRRARLPLLLAGFLAVVLGLGSGTAASFGIIAAGAPGINRALGAEESAGRHQGNEPIEKSARGGRIDLGRLAFLMFGIGAVGWILEGLVSSAILLTLDRGYPELLAGKE